MNGFLKFLSFPACLAMAIIVAVLVFIIFTLASVPAAIMSIKVTLDKFYGGAR